LVEFRQEPRRIGVLGAAVKPSEGRLDPADDFLLSRKRRHRQQHAFQIAPRNAVLACGRFDEGGQLLTDCRGTISISSMSVFDECMRWVTCIAAPILLADVGDHCFGLLSLDL
jgi:hypothetical protein